MSVEGLGVNDPTEPKFQRGTTGQQPENLPQVLIYLIVYLSKLVTFSRPA